MPINEIARLDFDVSSFTENAKEAISVLSNLESTQEQVKLSSKALQESINGISAAKPVKEMLQLKEALRNVGAPTANFKEFDKIFDSIGNDVIVLKQLLSDLKKELSNTSNPEDFKKLQSAIQQTEKAIGAFTNQTKEADKEATTLKQDYRSALTEIQIQLKATGGVWTKELIDKAKELGEQKDEIGDLQNVIKNFASDSFEFDAIVQGFQTVIGAVQLYSGAVALAGGDAQDYEETIAKLTALQGIASGVQQLYNSLQADSAFILGLSAVKANLASAAQAAYTFVVGTSTGALKAFRIALAATGIGAIVVALGALIANWEALTSAIDEAADNQKAFNDIRKEAFSDASKELTTLKTTYDLTQNLTLSTEQRTAAALELQKTYPTTFANFSTEEILLGKAASAYDKLTVKILKNAEVQAARSAIQKIADENFAKQLKAQELRESSVGITLATLDPFNLKNAKLLAKEGIRFISDGLDTVSEQAAQLEGEITANTKKADAIVKQFLTGDLANTLIDKQADEAAKSNTKKTIERRTKAAKERKDADKKEAEERGKGAIDFEKRILELQLEAEGERLNLLQDNFDKEKILIEFQSKERVASLAKSREDELKKITEAGLSAQLLESSVSRVNAAYDSLIDSAKQNELQKLAELSQRVFEEAAKGRSELNAAGQSGINVGENILQTDLTAQFNAGKISRTEFEKGQEQIQKQAQQQRLQLTISYLQKELQLYENVTGKEAEKQRNQLKEQLSEAELSLETLNQKSKETDLFGPNWQAAWDNLDVQGKFKTILDQYSLLAESVFKVWSAINQAEAKSLDKSIENQQKRVDEATKIAERGNAEYLQLEEERLNELQVKKEANARRQLAIDSALQASQILVAVAGAAAQIATGNPFAIIGGIAAIGAAIAAGTSLLSQLQSNAPSFYEGTEFLQRGKAQKGKDTILINAHEGERIVPSFINEKMQGVRNSELPSLVRKGLNYEVLANAVNFNRTVSLDNTETNNRLANVEKLLGQLLQNDRGTIVNASANPKAFIDFQIEYEKRKRLNSNA